MNSVIDYNTSSTIRLEESYKIPFSKYETQFLNWLYPEVMADPRHRSLHLLEVAVFHPMCQRLTAKIYAGEKCKMKFSLAEVLALKRILTRTAFWSNWKVEADSVLFKLDQLTVGIQ